MSENVVPIQRHKPEPAGKGDPVARLISADAERLMLGNILRGGMPFWQRVGDWLEPDDFALEAHRAMFSAMANLAQSGLSPDLGAVARVLLETDELSRVNGFRGLLDIEEAAFEIVDVEPWLKTLRRNSVDRRACKLASLIQQHAERGYSQAADEIAAAQRELSELEHSLVQTQESGTINDCLISIEGGLDSLFAKPRGQVTTPFGQLNRYTNGGFQRGQLWLLAARPSVGKSTAALQMALYAALRNRRTAFFSLEMPKAELLRRLLSQVAEIPHDYLVGGSLNPAERGRIRETIASIGSCPLEIHELYTLGEIIGTISQAKRGKYELAVVDYLGLIQTKGRFENRNQEVSSISRRLKCLAMSQQIPVIAVAQLNRASDVDNRAPVLSDLRDSGSLEQDADGVIFLHDPASMKRKKDAPPGEVQMILAKQRNGVRNVHMYMDFQAHYCRIVERERSEYEGS